MKPGSKWKEWTVEKYIGEGSFGKVYKIVKEEFGYKYESALKVIRIPQSSNQLMAVRNEGMSEEGVRSYFYSVVQSITSEFALMSQLSGNSNIVSYEDHTVSELKDEFGWEIFLRMELVTPLYEHLDKSTLTAGEVVSMGIDICRALEVCQKNKVIHRDIKPDNIFYSRQGAYKLGDFGIARKLEKMDAGMTKVGTFSYMAPEVYKGQKYDSTVDIYSLGLIMYQFFNDNRRPFLPPYPDPIVFSENEDANLKRMTGAEMPAPANSDEALSKVILKACAYDPEDRYQSASDMRSDLEKVLDAPDMDRVVFPFIDAESDKLVPLSEDPYSDETVTMFQTGVFPDAHINDTEVERETCDIPKAAMENGRKSSMKKRIVILLAIIAAIAGSMVYSYFNRTVPDVSGLTSKQAKEAIEDAGLLFEEGDSEFSDSVGRDKVITQSIAPGDKVKRKTVITLTLSRGRAVTVPVLTGKTIKKARAETSDLGLSLNEENEEYSDDVPKGRIIRQSVEAGSECESGTVISVVKSKGPEKLEIPDVASKAQDEAQNLLKKAGFKYKAVTQYNNNVAKGIVVSQDPAAGKLAEKKTTITIYVSAGAKPVTYSGNSGTSGKSSKKKASKKKTTARHAKGRKL